VQFDLLVSVDDDWDAIEFNVKQNREVFEVKAFDATNYNHDQPPLTADQILQKLRDDPTLLWCTWMNRYNKYEFSPMNYLLSRPGMRRLTPCLGADTKRVTIADGMRADVQGATDAVRKDFDKWWGEKLDIHWSEYPELVEAELERVRLQTVGDHEEAVRRFEWARDAALFQRCENEDEKKAVRRFFSGTLKSVKFWYMMYDITHTPEAEWRQRPARSLIRNAKIAALRAQRRAAREAAAAAAAAATAPAAAADAAVAEAAEDGGKAKDE
jgi:hypothetical protein